MALLKLRRNRLFYFTLVVYVGCLFLFALELDRAYQVRKKSLIIENYLEIFPIDRAHLTELARAFFFANTPARKEEAKNYIQNELNSIADSKLSIYQITLKDSSGFDLVSVDKPRKMKEFNTFSNSLFFRSFTGEAGLPVSAPMDSNKIIGRYVVRYTTPLDNAAIVSLTSQYRVYALITFAFLTAIFYYVLQFLIRPILRVVASIDREQGETLRIIKKPSTVLERYYNILARNALLMEFQTRAHVESASSRHLNHYQFTASIPPLANSLFPFFHIGILEIGRLKKGYVVRRAFFSQDNFEENMINENTLSLLEKATFLSSSESSDDNKSDRNFELNLNNKTFNTRAFSANFSQREDNRTLILILLKTPQSFEDPWLNETANLLAEQIENALAQAFMHRLLIFKEKSETSINLSRNLGHDLTNIIATGKLDLLTVQKFLTMSPESIELSPQRKEIFRQSLEALLYNMKFLQEIVNVYRAFSYIKKPIFETCDLNELVQDTATLFGLATSRGMKFETELHPQLPLCVVERRLIKLALFNMLTNAAESIQRRIRTDPAPGIIVIKTLDETEEEMLGIKVLDNGTGIRNEKGEIASEEEIDRIFALGYSTKQRDEGEGLGLNWVWSIVDEFHKGKVTVKNRSEGGAEFTIHLPLKPSEQKIRQFNAGKDSL